MTEQDAKITLVVRGRTFVTDVCPKCGRISAALCAWGCPAGIETRTPAEQIEAHFPEDEC